MFTDKSPLFQRLTFTAFIVPFTLLLIYFSDIPWMRPVFGLIIAGIIAMALWEFYRMAQSIGQDPTVIIGIAGSLAYVYSVYLETMNPDVHLLSQGILWISFLVAFLYYFYTSSQPFTNLAVSVFGVAYLTIPLSYMIKINYFQSAPAVFEGKWWLLYLIFVTKMTDVGGFTIGKLYGRRKLAPYISPGKTIEGSVGGLLVGIITSVIFYYLFQLLNIPFTITEALLLGVILSVLAQFGDLAESLLKRDAGVKDSNQLPGFGGMMDILDALVFVSPLMYFFLKSR